MNWLTNYVKPKLRELVGRRNNTPDNLWKKCTGCGQIIFHKELEKNVFVCQHCGCHMRISSKKRLKLLYDDGQFEQVELSVAKVDPLKFRDRKKYTERLKEAQLRTGDPDAILVGVGKMGNIEVVAAAINFSFMGGSMGVAVGDGIIAAARKSIELKAPLVVLTSSGGARMQEGIYSLMQLARTTLAIEEVKEARLPYIVVLCDPTTGGVSASFAMLGDIQIAEPGAIIGFAGQRVIEQTIHEKLPDGFQRSEYLLDHGMVDMVVHRNQLRQALIRVIGLLTTPFSDGSRIAKSADEEVLSQKLEAPLDMLPPDIPAPKLPKKSVRNGDP